MADQTFGLSITIDASGAVKGAAEFLKPIHDFPQPVKRANLAVRTLRRSMKVLGKTTRGVTKTMRGFGKVVGLVASLAGITGIVQGFKLATREALAFERNMAEISTLLDVVPGQVNFLAQELKNLSGQYGQDINSQAKALYDIISAGATSASEAIEILVQSNKLAVGGVSTTAIAADGLTSVLNAYGLAATDAARISDQLFTTVRLGKTTVNELATSLGRVAPIAAAAGIAFEEILASLALLTKGGLVITQAVTGIQQAISNFIKPAERAIKLADELGIAFGAATLRQFGFFGSLRRIRDAVGTDLLALGKLFGSIQALNSISSLLGSNFGELEDILDAVTNSAGAADEAFNKMADTNAFRVQTLVNKTKVAVIELGEQILILIAPILQALNDNFDVVYETIQKIIPAIISFLQWSQTLVYSIQSAGSWVGLWFNEGDIKDAKDTIADLQKQLNAVGVSSIFGDGFLSGSKQGLRQQLELVINEDDKKRIEAEIAATEKALDAANKNLKRLLEIQVQLQTGAETGSEYFEAVLEHLIEAQRKIGEGAEAYKESFKEQNRLRQLEKDTEIKLTAEFDELQAFEEFKREFGGTYSVFITPELTPGLSEELLRETKQAIDEYQALIADNAEIPPEVLARYTEAWDVLRTTSGQLIDVKATEAQLNHIYAVFKAFEKDVYEGNVITEQRFNEYLKLRQQLSVLPDNRDNNTRQLDSANINVKLITSQYLQAARDYVIAEKSLRDALLIPEDELTASQKSGILETETRIAELENRVTTIVTSIASTLDVTTKQVFDDLNKRLQASSDLAKQIAEVDSKPSADITRKDLVGVYEARRQAIGQVIEALELQKTTVGELSQEESTRLISLHDESNEIARVLTSINQNPEAVLFQSDQAALAAYRGELQGIHEDIQRILNDNEGSSVTVGTLKALNGQIAGLILKADRLKSVDVDTLTGDAADAVNPLKRKNEELKIVVESLRKRLLDAENEQVKFKSEDDARVRVAKEKLAKELKGIRGEYDKTAVSIEKVQANLEILRKSAKSSTEELKAHGLTHQKVTELINKSELALFFLNDELENGCESAERASTCAEKAAKEISDAWSTSADTLVNVWNDAFNNTIGNLGIFTSQVIGSFRDLTTALNKEGVKGVWGDLFGRQSGTTPGVGVLEQIQKSKKQSIAAASLVNAVAGVGGALANQDQSETVSAIGTGIVGLSGGLALSGQITSYITSTAATAAADAAAAAIAGGAKAGSVAVTTASEAAAAESLASSSSQLAGTASTVVAYAGAIIGGFTVGSALGQKLGASEKNANVGATIGTAIGAIWGPLFAFLGGVLGGAIGSIAGGSKRVTDTGLDLGITGGQLQGQQFYTYKKKKAYFKGYGRNREVGSDLDDDFVEGAQGTLDNAFDQIQAIGDALDTESNVFDNFNSAIKRISLRGLDDAETQKAVEGYLHEVIEEGILFFIEGQENLSERLRKVVKSFRGDTEALIQAFDAMTRIEVSLSDTSVGFALRAIEIGSRSLTTALGIQLADTLELAAAYDGSLESLQALADAVVATTESQVQLVIALTAVADASADMFRTTADNIRESVLEEEDLYNVRRDLFAKVVADIRSTRDPNELETFAGQADAILRSAYDILNKEQRTPSVLADLLLDLENLEKLVAGQASLGIIDTEAGNLALDDAVTEGLLGSAELQMEAATNFNVGVDKFDRVVTRLEETVFNGAGGIGSPSGYEDILAFLERQREEDEENLRKTRPPTLPSPYLNEIQL